MKGLLLFLALNFFKTPCGLAQDGTFWSAFDTLPHPTKNDTLHVLHNSATPNYKKRRYGIAGLHGASYVGTLAILETAWYKEYPKAPFHLFNDSREWLQIDKAGHAWTAYNIANYSTALWRWAGVPHQKAIWFGGLSSLGFQTIIELLDAHSSQWGFSWADMGANAVGAALFTGQELAWSQQRFVVKFSSFPQRHAASVRPRAEDLFGTRFQERLLKDYNSQTYWASFNLHSFLPNAALPRWLNLAVGYGATGMYGGFKNIAYDKTGAVIFTRTDIKRVRQWYVSPDIDWTKLRTNKKAVRTLFTVLNMIKVPTPTLELSDGKLKGAWFYF